MKGHPAGFWVFLNADCGEVSATKLEIGYIINVYSKILYYRQRRNKKQKSDFKFCSFFYIMGEKCSFCVLSAKNIKYLIVSDRANTSIYTHLSLRKEILSLQKSLNKNPNHNKQIKVIT